MTQARRRLGQSGEDAAARHYIENGYEVVARNWRPRDAGLRGELDLIAYAPTAHILVICEVKTRSSNAFGTPAEAVDWRKQSRIRKLAALWLRANHHRSYGELRFDVACVIGGNVEIIEAAF